MIESLFKAGLLLDESLVGSRGFVWNTQKTPHPDSNYQIPAFALRATNTGKGNRNDNAARSGFTKVNKEEHRGLLYLSIYVYFAVHILAASTA